MSSNCSDDRPGLFELMPKGSFALLFQNEAGEFMDPSGNPVPDPAKYMRDMNADHNRNQMRAVHVREPGPEYF